MQWAGSTLTDWRKSGISIVTRLAIGLPLAAVLSVIGMATASAMSVFFGVSGLPTLLALLMIGAGIGAGISGGTMLFRVDAVPPWPILILIGLALATLSTLGAWVGHDVGELITSNQKANCVGVCDYLFKPRTYMALGAIVVSNIVVLISNIVYETRVVSWAWARMRSREAEAGRSCQANADD